MFQKLVSHNDDVRLLLEKGYAITSDGGYLIVRDIPYLNDKRGLETGAFVAKLNFIDELRVAQTDHQVFFAGGIPHELDGTPVRNLAGGPTTFALGEASSDIVVQRSFSNKPPTGAFADFFEKIESYVALICGPAVELHNATPYTYRHVSEDSSTSVFKFEDTLTSRAEIGDLSRAFSEEVVAVIGLGGTGSYLLDFLVKTPVREIRAFDLDPFHVHNAYRSPGRLTPSELGMPKADVYKSRYENFRTGLHFESLHVDSSTKDQLDQVTFAFVCVDKGPARAGVFDALLSLAIPFIDVGMGIKRKHEKLSGMLRTTYFSAEQGAKVRQRGLAPLQDGEENLYRTNIQIGELNALNACLAIIKYKQLRGFYCEDLPYHHLLFDIADLKTVGEHETDQNPP